MNVQKHNQCYITLLVCLLAIACAERTLQVSITPNNAPKTVPFNRLLANRSEDIGPDDIRVKKLGGSGCEAPEQVHLTYWSSSSVLVSWASCDSSTVAQPRSTDNIRSVVFYGTEKHALFSRAEGMATSYALDHRGLGYGTSYSSPLLHHVLLTGLTPGVTYYYKPADSSSSGDSRAKPKDAPTSGRTFSFAVPKPAAFPLRLGVLGDPGQTHNTSETLGRLMASKPQMLILLGDFAYADNWLNFSQPVSSQQWSTVSFQPKWDTWGRLFEPLLSSVPLLHTNGNHEMEPQRNGDRATAYNHRFPTPQLSGHDYSKGPSHFSPASPARPFSNLYYSVELPGVMKYIALTSYAPQQTFSADEEQYKWLQRELQQVDRVKTPWVLVAIHAPWYHTYKGHYKEVECMRQAYEPLLVAHQVDLVLSGHVHAYERSKPVVSYQVNDCGPMYLTVGDGGNIEGIYMDYVDLALDGQPEFCKDPQAFADRLFPKKYQPQACITYQDGNFCVQQQPEWSAYREPSFGFGTLELLSPTTAKFIWRKNQWPGWQVGDEVTITRGGAQRCGQVATEIRQHYY